jgi:predicted lactoylglutathione lyase
LALSIPRALVRQIGRNLRQLVRPIRKSGYQIERERDGYKNFRQFTRERSQEVDGLLHEARFQVQTSIYRRDGRLYDRERGQFAMLLTRDKFKTFTPKEICDATKSTEVLVCLSCESRDNVNELVRKAIAAGGATYNQPQDHGFMYGHGFQDLDGHIWELIYMEPSAVK